MMGSVEVPWIVPEVVPEVVLWVMRGAYATDLVV